MCRFAFYTGPARPLASVLYTPSRSLEQQAYRPREQQHGVVNVDGTGVAWWPDGDEPPLRYVTPSPPWSDPNLPQLPHHLEGHTILAAVRGATPGMGFGAAFTAPFLHDGVAFAHNGWIGGFRDGIGAQLVRRLPDDLASGMGAVSDSTVLFSTVLSYRRLGSNLHEAVRCALDDVAVLCQTTGEQATLNVLVSDGRETIATRRSIGLSGNSLYVASESDGSVTVASEPLDDGAWDAVEDDTLVRVHSGRVQHHRLPTEPNP